MIKVTSILSYFWNENGNRPSREVLSDRFGRQVKKLRISITDRCNVRCVYCMPENPKWKPHEEILTYEDISLLAGIFVKHLGIEALRITGGEPLLRKDLHVLIERLALLQSSGLKRLSLCTNGFKLKDFSSHLKEAGLDDVNVSLDSLDPKKFQELTGRRDLGVVLEGIEEAQKAGLCPKVNAVIIRGRNDNEITSLVRWARHIKVILRFIEFMPLDGRGYWRPELVVPEREIIDHLKKEFEVIPIERSDSGPASYYLINESFQVGVIPTVSNPFCLSCDRIRLAADGRLLNCLFSTEGFNLKDLLRSGIDEGALFSAIKKMVLEKPENFIALKNTRKNQMKHMPMYALGGFIKVRDVPQGLGRTA